MPAPLTTFPGRGPRVLAPGRRRRGRLFANETRQLLRLAGPIVVSQLGNIAMNLTDTLMVAPLGPEALAAAAVGFAVHVTAIMVCTGTLMGMSPLVSQAFGAGDRDECRRILVNGLWLGLVLALPVTAVSLNGPWVAGLLGQEPAVGELAGGFLLSLAPGIVATMLYFACRQYLDAIGLTWPAMVLTFLGVAVNIVGNTILIWGVEGVVPPLGVVGAGLSTSIVRWAMVLGMVVFFLRRPDLSPVGRVSLRPAWARVRRVLGVGAPVGAQMGAEVGIFSLAAVMMGWLGAVQLAAHQVAINVASATFMVGVGVSLAGSIRVGQHIGARNPRAVHRAATATYLLSLGFMGVCALAFLVFPETLIGLYTSDPEIIRYGTGLLFMAALFQIFDGAQATGLAVLRGAADTRVPMLITLLGYWVVGLPAAYLLGFRTEMEHVGIWAGLSLALAVVGVLLAWRARLVLWRRPLVPAAQAPAPPHAGEAGEGGYPVLAGD